MVIECMLTKNSYCMLDSQSLLLQLDLLVWKKHFSSLWLYLVSKETLETNARSLRSYESLVETILLAWIPSKLFEKFFRLYFY